MNSITQKDKLPLATQKTKDGVELYWIEELNLAGIHLRGIAELLGCNPKTVHEVLSRYPISFLEAEILTEGGIQGVTLFSEKDFIEILKAINLSKAKLQTREAALDLITKFAVAGFKLLVMMELAPQQLAKKAVENARVKQLEEKLLESQAEIQEWKDSYSKLAIAGTQPMLIPQTIDSVDELTEAARRRNLAEMEAVGTPGTTQYERAKTVSRGLRFGWKR